MFTALTVAAVGIWELVVRVMEPPTFLFPSASATIRVLFQHRDVLFHDSLVTAFEAVAGLLLSCIAAISVATLTVFLPRLQRILLPVVAGFQAVPLVAVAPLLIIWLGNGFSGKVVLAALVSFFPLTVNSVIGLNNVPPDALEVFHLLGASRTRVLLMLRVHFAAPFFMAALRIGSGLSVIGAIVAEFAAADVGIGFRIMIASYKTDTPLLFAAIILGAAISVAMHSFARFVEKRIDRALGSNRYLEPDPEIPLPR